MSEQLAEKLNVEFKERESVEILRELADRFPVK